MIPSARRFPLAMLLLFSMLPATGAAAPPSTVAGSRRISLNADWRFAKAEARGAEPAQFDDSAWRVVRLPHDWAIEGPFDPKLNPHTGALPISGTGWYRKHFLVSEKDKGACFSVLFDGAMSNAHVWLNGHELGERPYGYIGFAFDLTPFLNYGNEENVLAVRVAPEPNSSRWYPGAGIYRNVWMDITAPVHVGLWGTYVTTPEVTDAKAAVAVKTEVRNERKTEAHVGLRTSIIDADGRAVVSSTADLTIPANGTVTASGSLTVPHPQRWDLDRPYLYTLVSEVLEGDRTIDRYTTPFGIRTVAFDAKAGFSLNGRHRKLQGVCMHHDLGALGAAVNRRALERQLEILKGAGVNAIRTSHNPPAPELLEACDRMGLVVMDEAFDMWRKAKTTNDYSKHYAEWSERDVRDLVRRDRNHPSVIMWSIGNEIPEQRSPEGRTEAHRLVGFFHDADPTRPTTSAFNLWTEAIRNGLADEVDLAGFNYRPVSYEQIMREHPNWVVYGSETASCVSSRGVYHLPIEKYQKHASLQLSGYDIIAPPWAYCPDPEFDVQERFPNLLGEFVWTGFDYIGEPTPYFARREDNASDWPARSSYFGMVDLAGFPKDRYYLYQSVWTTKPMVHLLPHWNWAGREGQNIPVMCYSNADEVELFLNGHSLGRKKRFSEPVELPVGDSISPQHTYRSKYRLLWQVPYAPGELKAIGYTGGKQVASETVRTAGAPAKVVLAADRNTIQADGDDLSFLTVRVEDKSGNFCPEADNLVRFRVEGPGTIAGVDNGNAASVEPFQGDSRKAFNGLALLIVRSKEGDAGRIRITASSEGLAGGEATVTTKR